MKKVTLTLVALLIGAFAFAADDTDLWSYTFTGFATAPELAADSGAGAGWYISLLQGGSEVDSTSGYLNAAGSIYIQGWTMTASLLEGTDVSYRIYSQATLPTSGAYWYLDSNAITLPQADAPLGGTALDVDHSGAFSGVVGGDWVEVVPEPATVGLFGLGALSAWIIRRNKLKSREEV